MNEDQLPILNMYFTTNSPFTRRVKSRSFPPRVSSTNLLVEQPAGERYHALLFTLRLEESEAFSMLTTTKSR
jgi:hypothetical protein